MEVLVNASASLQSVQAVFLAILPRIQQHGQIYFRHQKCQSAREDCIAEMVAMSWKWFITLSNQGKNPASFVSAIASYAARAVKSGRRLCAQEKANDVMSPVAQQRRCFVVGKLPDFSTLLGNPLADALIDNTQTPPDEQAAFRCDFPAWLCTLDHRRRQIAEELMMGERTAAVSNKHGCSPARISQMRREFMEGWQQFCGD
jgi:hypothetical protein